MKEGGTKYIVSLYVTVSIGTWVVFPVSFPPVLGLDLLQFDRRTVAEGVVGEEGTILFLTFASSMMVEHSQRESALGRVISFDFVILSVSMTIPFALAPDPSKQTSFMSGRVLVPPCFLKPCNALIFPSLPVTNATVSSSSIRSFIFSNFDFLGIHGVVEQRHVCICRVGASKRRKRGQPTGEEVHSLALIFYCF
jgi:hypothetical protein